MMNWAMNNWTRRHTLIAGLALILLTNGVALLGVHFNRSGEPESTLKLSQRELQSPYGWGMNRENSGVALRINWRTLSGKGSWSYSFAGGQPEWLDSAKMASLGFDVIPPAGTVDGYRWSRRQLSREVLLVLEMDGPAYQQALQRAQKYVAEQDAKLAALPGDKAIQESAKRAHGILHDEEQDYSRLFAVDAGLSLAELRAKYPDHTRYAIVHALVRPQWYGEKENRFSGFIEKMSIDEINVPLEYHALLKSDTRQSGDAEQHAFEATVAFGQRLEPWLLGMAAQTK